MTNNNESTVGLWTFDSARDEQASVPSIEKLQESWRFHHGETTELISPNECIYGTYELPVTHPSFVVSLDLCEVVRQTGPSLTSIYSNEDFAHQYGDYYGDSLLGDNPQQAREILLPHLMNMNHVAPVPFSEVIALFMRRWRQAGAYIVANTSTLPGCEESTIRFLAEQYSGTTQGILFPRNHDGRGSNTKANILAQALEDITAASGYDLQTVPRIAIEDAEHHATDYVQHPDDIHVFMPEYSWNESLERSTDVTRVRQGHGTVDTFIAIDDHLTSRGIL